MSPAGATVIAASARPVIVPAVGDLDAVWQLLAAHPATEDPHAGALDYLTALTRAQQALAGELDRAVLAAVTAGADWAQIGRATGRTRQGARQRWNRFLPPPAPPPTPASDAWLPVLSDDPWDRRPPPRYSPPELLHPRLHTRLADHQVRHDQPPDDPWPAHHTH
ncbi:Hypothetical protein FRAAL5423 [Frankia alni ACN14a]|uniref:Uncharacterized protein n=1 Tax=Frankia alni (strain DSM 45986 / CECT 9034 / ACN14a) TaxID=326424 RepID=Q0REQ1_FRAAA|nr:Hypothetical protein FRAAL5423 [Frankia alni ACN14a]